MRFVLYGGLPEERAMLKKFAEILGVEFVEAQGGKEALLVVEFPTRRTNPLKTLWQRIRPHNKVPPMEGAEGAEGAQNPLPGLETPPCR